MESDSVAGFASQTQRMPRMTVNFPPVNFSKKHLDFSRVMCENKASGYDRLIRDCYEIIYT